MEAPCWRWTVAIVLGEEPWPFGEKVKGPARARARRSSFWTLKNVTMIDISGLGALVAAHSSAKIRGSSVAPSCNLG